MSKKLAVSIDIEHIVNLPDHVSIPEDLNSDAEMKQRLRDELDLTRDHIDDVVQINHEVVTDVDEATIIDASNFNGGDG